MVDHHDYQSKFWLELYVYTSKYIYMPTDNRLSLMEKVHKHGGKWHDVNQFLLVGSRLSSITYVELLIN